MVLDGIRRHGPERADPHVEREEGHGHARRVEPAEELGCEVKAGGRRRDGAGPLGVDRLVALFVQARTRGPVNVRRQRRHAQPGQQVRDRRALHAQDRAALLAVLQQHGARLGPEADRVADLRAARGVHQHFPRAGDAFFQEQDFHLAARGLGAEYAGRDHPGIVGHQQVVRPEEVRQVPDAPMVQGAGPALDDQHPRLVAPGRGLLGDPVGGQLVIEVLCSHGVIS